MFEKKEVTEAEIFKWHFKREPEIGKEIVAVSDRENDIYIVYKTLRGSKKGTWLFKSTPKSTNEETLTTIELVAFVKDIVVKNVIPAYLLELKKEKAKKRFLNRNQPIVVGWNMELEDMEPLLTFNGAWVLFVGGICTIVAAPGVGKSTVCEAMVAGVISEKADSFGFKCNLHDQKALLVDMERNRTELYGGYVRINKNAGFIKPAASDLVKVRGFASMDSIEAKKDRIIEYLEMGNIGLLIVDGVSDGVNDVNDQKECSNFLNWLRATAHIYGIGVVVTLHVNPNDEKPRGHLGSDLCRRSESVLGIFEMASEDDKILKVITSDFSFGKVRHGRKDQSTVIEWSDEKGSFVTSAVPHDKEARKSLKKEKLLNQVKEAFEDEAALKPTLLRDKLVKITGFSIDHVRKSVIPGLVANGLLCKDDQSNYRLS